MMQKYIMGIDAGGTKTCAVITASNGEEIGSGLSGEANHQTIGIDQAFQHIKEAIDLALEEAHLNYQDIDFVQYALAGADRPTDFNILEPALEKLPFKKWNLVCDTMAGLRSGSTENEGVVLVCGTGTNAAGKNVEGEQIQTGGFGYMYGDQAGGSYIAQETFRASIRSWEQREVPSILVDKVLNFLGFRSMEELLNHYLDGHSSGIPAELTLILHEAADAGDELSIRILESVGVELGIAAKSVIKRIGSFAFQPLPIVLIGSVLQKGRSDILLNALKACIIEEFPEIILVIPKMEPVYGAVLLGMDQLDISTPPEMTEKFIHYGGY